VRITIKRILDFSGRALLRNERNAIKYDAAINAIEITAGYFEVNSIIKLYPVKRNERK
jgi:hypothetical protein